MGTKNKGGRFGFFGHDEPPRDAVEGMPSGDAAAPSTQAAAPQPAAGDNPATMRKGIYLSALIYVEGDQAPAANFADAARKALTDALSKPGGAFTFSVKKAQVENNVDDAEEGDDAPSVAAPPSGKSAAPKKKAKQPDKFEF